MDGLPLDRLARPTFPPIGPHPRWSTGAFDRFRAPPGVEPGAPVGWSHPGSAGLQGRKKEKALVTSATLVVTGALLIVTTFAIRINFNSFLLLLVRHLLLVAMPLLVALVTSTGEAIPKETSSSVRSVLFLVVRPGATSSFLLLVAMPLLLLASCFTYSTHQWFHDVVEGLTLFDSLYVRNKPPIQIHEVHAVPKPPKKS